METIDDIVREMREFADTESQSIGRDVLRRRIQHFADRIKKAQEFELAVEKAKAADEGYAAGKQSVTNCNQLNQVMSDVLKFIMDVIEKNYAKETTAKDALFRIYGCVGITLKEIERKENHGNH